MKNPEPIEEQQHYRLSHKQLGKALMASLADRCTLPMLKKEIGCFNMHIVKAYRALTSTVLEKAFQALIVRHENFRTVFTLADGEIRQRILPAEMCMANYLFFDLRDRSQPYEKSEEIVRHLIATEFDFFKEPPFKAACIQLTDHDSMVALVINHVAFDFYSARTIEEEFGILYESLEGGATAQLAPLPVQIKDFAAWEHAAVTDTAPHSLDRVWAARLQKNIPRYVLRDYAKDKHYIQENLTYSAGLEEEVKTYFNDVRPDEVGRLKGVVHRATAFDGASYRFVLPQDVCDELKKIGLRSRSTLFGVFTALSFILLYRLSGVKNLVVGLESAIRDIAVLRNVVGWMANTVLLRAKIDETMTINSFVHAVFKESLEAAQHKIFPFEKVLQKLDEPLDAIGALYLNFTTYKGVKDALITDFQPAHNFDDRPYFDFDCFFTVYDNGTEIVFRYKTELFDAERIVHFSQLFMEIVMEVVSRNNLLLAHFAPRDMTSVLEKSK